MNSENKTLHSSVSKGFTQNFVPPAPAPRQGIPSVLSMIKVLYNNPIELWGEPSYNEPYVYISQGFGAPLLVANDPALIRHLMVENASNYKMGRMRQTILKPILREGLLVAEGDIWKRSRRSMAPVFTPRHIHDFAEVMLKSTNDYAQRYDNAKGSFDIASDMTQLTFDILAQTLFSGEIEGNTDEFLQQVEILFETAAKVDPMDLLDAPRWIPRISKVRGRKPLAFFRKIVKDTVQARRVKMQSGKQVPDDFMTLLLNTLGPEGLTLDEIEDNVITFFGAGHETTARSLAWTLYLLAKAPHEREKVEKEIDDVLAQNIPAVEWLDNMPFTRAAFEESMRLYPPVPTIAREAVEEDFWHDGDGKQFTIAKGCQVLVMPWTLHRHNLYWENPSEFDPSRFLPQNRDKIDRYQYLPFGAGPRICIGASFSLQEAVIVLGVLMSRFRFDMAPNAKEPWPVQKLTTQPEGGLQMVATPRK